MSALIVVGAMSVLALVFLGLYGVLWTLETLFPAFSRWLDRTVGPK